MRNRERKCVSLAQTNHVAHKQKRGGERVATQTYLCSMWCQGQRASVLPEQMRLFFGGQSTAFMAFAHITTHLSARFLFWLHQKEHHQHNIQFYILIPHKKSEVKTTHTRIRINLLHKPKLTRMPTEVDWVYPLNLSVVHLNSSCLAKLTCSDLLNAALGYSAFRTAQHGSARVKQTQHSE